MNELGHTIIHYECVNSTMDAAREQLNRPDAHGIIVTADEQTAGRGTRGSPWLSSSGQSLLMSFIMSGSMKYPESYSIWPGVAICQAMEDLGTEAHRIRLKWPNDVLVDEHKLAGVLVEATLDHIIVGIGINLSQDRDHFLLQGLEHAVSISQLFAETSTWPRSLKQRQQHVFDQLLSRLRSNWEKWKHKDDGLLLTEWKRYFHLLNHTVILKSTDKSTRGMVIDLGWKDLVLRSEHQELISIPLHQIKQIIPV